MERQQVQKRLNATLKLIGELEKCIADTEASKSDMDPRVYTAMIDEYASQLTTLRRDEKEYREMLKK